MALIKIKPTRNNQLIKTKIDAEVFQEVKDYCEWAGIFDLGFFIEEIAKCIFKNDIEWKQYQKAKRITDF